MTETQNPVVLPSSLEEVVAQIAVLPLNAYDVLKKEIRSIRGFDADKVRSDALADRLPLSAENIAVVLSALSFMYSRVNSIAGGSSIDSAVNRMLDSFSPEEFDPKLKNDAAYRLKQLLAVSAEIEQSRKIRRLKNGFLKNATAFASFVDARPDFDDSNDVIRGFIAVVQFKVSTDADIQSEKEFVFQVDEAGLASLKSAIEAAEKKLKTLSREDALVAPLYNNKMF